MSTHHDGPGDDRALSERLESLAAWINDLDAQLKATAVTGDAKALKELAKALEAWNKHDPKLEQRITNRVDVLADRFATLAGTVNTTAAALAGKDGEIAQLRRELEEGNARIEAVVRELRQSGPSTDVSDLRKAVAALSQERKSGGSDRRIDAITGEVDVLAQRLDTLSKTVSTTAAGLAGKEGELAALRARLEDGDTRAESVVAEIRASVAELSRNVAGIGDRPHDTQSARIFENHLLDLGARVEQLTERLDAVSADVLATSAGLAANEGQLAAVHRQFEEVSSTVEATVDELRELVETLPVAGSVSTQSDEQLDAVSEHLEAVGRRVDALTAQISRLEADTAARWDDAVTARLQVEQLLAEVTRRLAEAENMRDAAASEVERSARAWAEERLWVRGQLEMLAAAVDETRPDETVEPRLQELAARVHSMEQGQQMVGAEISRIAAAWDAERDALKGELDSLVASVAAEAGTQPATVLDDRSEQLLHALAARLDEMEREGAAVAAEITRVATSWTSELGSLEARIEEVAGAARGSAPADPRNEERVAELLRRLDALERDREQTGVGTPADSEELHEMRVLINGLRMRVASSEKELAALSGSGDIVPRLDDLSLRLSMLERATAAAPSEVAPVPGDGRFRVELRGLDLRMQQLESAARENRDAVLTQFERLASRLQWRLQQLELENADAGYGPSKAAAPQLGQVVPIRSEG